MVDGGLGGFGSGRVWWMTEDDGVVARRLWEAGESC